MELLDNIIYGKQSAPKVSLGCFCRFKGSQSTKDTLPDNDSYELKIASLGPMEVSLFTMEYVAHAYINACRHHPDKSERIQKQLIQILHAYAPKHHLHPINTTTLHRIVYDLKSLYVVQTKTITAMEACMR
jgi:hypothetical protein